MRVQLLREYIRILLELESSDDERVAFGSDEYEKSLYDLDNEEEQGTQDAIDAVQKIVYDDAHLWATGEKPEDEESN